MTIPDELLDKAIKAQTDIINIMQEEDSKFFGTTINHDHTTAMQLRISTAIVQWLYERGKL